GALSNLSHVGINGSNQDVYTATFTPAVTNSEAGSVQVNASSYGDLTGNAGAASNTVSFAGDTQAPALVITSNVQSLKIGEQATITFTFSEDPGATFTAGDVAVSGGTLGALSGSGLTRTALF